MPSEEPESLLTNRIASLLNQIIRVERPPSTVLRSSHLRESALDLYERINIHRRVLGLRELSWNEQLYEIAHLHNGAINATNKLSPACFTIGISYDDIVFQMKLSGEERKNIAQRRRLWRPAQRIMKILLKRPVELSFLYDPINQHIGIDLCGCQHRVIITILISIHKPFSTTFQTRGMPGRVPSIPRMPSSPRTPPLLRVVADAD